MEYVKKEQPDVSLDTVYRNLSVFKQLAIVNEIQMINQDGNRFEISRDGHHHHIICLKCGKIECLQKCPVSKEAIETIEKNGFAVVSHSLEFYGYCSGCQKESNDFL
ncbi:Zinc-specific metallo-regulatory protein [bioreactor metagenome]|uniref:Zinc-specific metallo-regulatory protein n=1 Tax=bioreactor metagenome TaxID=1076179 RepID=A0A645B8Z7_9ZZZZ